jgi:PAS domain S-box-containing protein
MDIRTKFVFALVAVALGSMAFLGVTLYREAERALKDGRLEQLEGLAESNKEGLEQIFQGWIDRVQLVASRTQLRLSLEEYNRTGDPRVVPRITRILSDAVEAVEVIENLTLHGPDGSFITSAGGEPVPSAEQDRTFAFPVADRILYEGVAGTGSLNFRAGFLADLVLDGEILGHVHVRLNARGILDLAEKDLGLGESGETIIVTMDAQGTPRLLHRLRPGGPGIWEMAEPGGPNDLVTLALEAPDTVIAEGVTDAQGKAVWAAFRGLPEEGLRLVVKVDQEEGRAPLMDFRERSIRLTLTLGAFAALVGAILGIRFSRPIKELASVADRIKEGTLSARADETGEDEVGFLSRTFNDMADELEEQVTLLREFKNYFEFSRDMLCIAGPDAFFKRVNPAFEKTLGWTTEDLMSQSFLSFVHPEDLEKTEDEITRLAHGMPTISFQNRYRTASGTYKHLEWTAHPDEESGLIYAIARDVTEQQEVRKRVAEELRTLRHRVKEAEANPRGDS